MRRMLTAVTLTVLLVACATAENDHAAAPAATAKGKLPGITVNARQRYVDIAARVVLREGLLELVGCIADSKEHESIVALDAKARHIHLGLLMLGANPGSPTKWVVQSDKSMKRILPSGDRVRVTFVFDEDGREAERSVTRYIIDGKKRHPKSDVFLFAGSNLRKTEDGRTVYEADESGDAISLVSFGDELLVWPDPAASDYSTLDWYADPESIPVEGTKLRVRLRVVAHRPRGGESDRPAEGE